MTHRYDADDSDEFEPEEDDLRTDDHVNFYQNGKRVLTLQVREKPRRVGESWPTRDAEEGELSDEQIWKQLREYMERTGFFPNVWWISDHGNAHLLTPPKKKRSPRKKR